MNKQNLVATCACFNQPYTAASDAKETPSLILKAIIYY